MSFYDSITKGLNEAIEYEKGKIKLKSHTVSILPTPYYTKDDIKNIRQSLGFTQVVFAGIVGVSPKTIEAWEAGRNHPVGSSSRMLQLLQKDPQIIERTGIIEGI